MPDNHQDWSPGDTEWNLWKKILGRLKNLEVLLERQPTQPAVRIILRAVINQSSAGNLVIAAAIPGNKHKVIGFILQGPKATAQFFSGTTALTGAFSTGDLTPIMLPPNPLFPLLETAVNQSLNITSGAAGLKGVILYLTEP